MSEWLNSVISGSVSQITPRYLVGDRVEVLRAARLPKVEEVMGTGRVERISGSDDAPLYWVSGFECARSARELRLIVRGLRVECPTCEGDGFDMSPFGSNCKTCGGGGKVWQ